MDKDYSVSGLATCSVSRRRTAVSRSALLAGLKLNLNICLGLFLEYLTVLIKVKGLYIERNCSEYLRGAPNKQKTYFLGDFSQMWEGGVADSQTWFKPLKSPQIHPKIAFFDPDFTFRSPKSLKNPGVDG